MRESTLSMDDLIRRARAHPRIGEAGMILCHNGIVRGSDRSGGKRVRGLRVTVDAEAITAIREWGEAQPGIVTVLIEALEGDFAVGDDLLYVVVAGDIRENVFSAMREIVERIKAGGVSKTEFYYD
ncbi:MAG: molybdenum cofactor biosynthesis protein MoaE [Deltaproteobacteria bacterium]